MCFLCLTVFTAIIIVFLATKKRYRWFYIIAKTFRRDIRGVIAFCYVNVYTKRCIKNNTTVVSECLLATRKNPEKVAFYFENQVWTFAMVEEYINKIAQLFLNEGFKKGDTIALMLENRPEYPAIWMGISQLGIRTALINTNLTSDPLLHCLRTVNSRAIIYSSDFASRLAEIRESLEGFKFYEIQDDSNVCHPFPVSIKLKQRLAEVPNKRLEAKYIVAQSKDPVIYIYTSGTTGLPKAAVLSNIRCLVMLKVICQLSGYKPVDIAYIPLPLYHIAAGVGGVAQTLINGATCVLARKFSATNFFKDCEKYNVTVIQYIGEMCRYLLALPEDVPIKHKIHSMCGNGLRPHLWKPFVDRFKIKNIFEIYAATEGISNMLNIDNKPGAIGFVPRYLRNFYPVRLIKCDEATGEPLRNRQGLCTECGVDEPGIAIGKIDPKKTVSNFEGYTDQAETQKKILRDVFEIGDMYFNSGDLLMFDEFGYFYFRDRTGDTFRWKGENVSTSEVEGVIGGIIKHGDVAVYGVEIPHTEGRAGMAAIVEGNKNFNVDVFCQQLREHLPTYAVPVFIRLIKSLQLTGTYKLQKIELKAEGFDIAKVTDTIYFYDTRSRKYVKLTKELYDEIISGTIRV